MVKIEIVKSLALEIKKKFSKTEANKIIDLLYTLEESPHKGKILTNVAGIVIKELKYKKFRFYFITDGHKLKVLSKERSIFLGCFFSKRFSILCNFIGCL